MLKDKSSIIIKLWFGDDINDKRYDKGIESWPFDKPFFLICNLAIGGNWGGPIDDSAFPMEFNIKSIKVYEIKEWDIMNKKTIYDLAAELKVAPSTISKALNNKKGVNPETKKRSSACRIWLSRFFVFFHKLPSTILFRLNFFFF